MSTTHQDGPRGSVRVIELPVVSDTRGDLTFVESRRHVPFDIARVYRDTRLITIGGGTSEIMRELISRNL